MIIIIDLSNQHLDQRERHRKSNKIVVVKTKPMKKQQDIKNTDGRF